MIATEPNEKTITYVGIDPGRITGVGYITPKEKGVKSLKIHNAMNFLMILINEYGRVHIRVEDARQRKYFGHNSMAKQQGAGSIKRDCTIWNEFLADLKKQYPMEVSYQMLHPIKGGTKLNSGIFKRLTGVKGKTSSHGRDAFMLIHDFKL